VKVGRSFPCLLPAVHLPIGGLDMPPKPLRIEERVCRQVGGKRAAHAREVVLLLGRPTACSRLAATRPAKVDPRQVSTGKPAQRASLAVA
jgi:hypothetical protein